MRLAISNIAWDVAEDDAVAALLGRYHVDAIDVAPAKYFREARAATDPEIRRVRDRWQQRGIEITGMQALLLGTSGLNLFGSAATQAAMLEHLGVVCRIGSVLGATRLVFGSPRNRDRSGLDDEQAMAVAVGFFRRLGDIAQARAVTICLEPNPQFYGANFMTTSREAADVVRRVDHPAIRLQLDAGAMTMNRETPATIVSEHAALIGHIHLSEPHLVPLGEGGTDHHALFAALSSHLPGALVSIEMLATTKEPHLASIERALAVARRVYHLVPAP